MSQWKYFEINSVPWIIKFVINNEKVECFLCDFTNLFRENLSLSDLILRAKEKNPLIEHDKELVLNTIFETTEHCKFENEILTFKYYIQETPFHFYWCLEKCSSKDFLEVVTSSFILQLIILQEQNKELQSIIKKKDLEIEQYKFEGATLIRKQLITNKFDENYFNEKYKMAECENDFIDLIGTKENNKNKKSLLKLCGVSETKFLNAIKTDNKTPQKDNILNVSKVISPTQKRKKEMRQKKFQTKSIKMCYDSNSESSSQEISKEEEKNIPSPAVVNVPIKKNKFRKDLNF